MDGKKQTNLCYGCEFQKVESRAFYEDGKRTPSHIHIQRECKIDPTRDCYKRTSCKDFKQAVLEMTQEEFLESNRRFKEVIRAINHCGICNKVMFSIDVDPICDICKKTIEEGY